MTYAEKIRLYEKKDHLIKRTKMTDEQKAEVIEFFTKHREQENQISGDEWNKPELLTYERFKQVIDAFNNRNTKSRANKIANKIGIAGLTEGEDYVDWGEFEDNILGTFHVYTPLSHLGAKTIAGKTVKPYPENGKDSASWCIGQTDTDEYWNSYFFRSNTAFLVVCGNEIPSKKACFEIQQYYDTSIVFSKRWNLKFNDYYNKNNVVNDVIVWNYRDYSTSFDDFLSKIIDNSKKELQGNQDYLALGDTFTDLIAKAKKVSDKLRDSLLEKKEADTFKRRTAVREIRNFTYGKYNFPMIEMGERAEGRVFGSYYLTADDVPFSPCYSGGWEYQYGCNHWDISIVRQWLNSDAPAGQWYKEYDVDGCKVDWNTTPQSTLKFIEKTDGFLKIIGINKSQLTSVKNITYIKEGSSLNEVTTEDYVWIPSLSELSTNYPYKEGEPLDYWKKLLGENATQQIIEDRAMRSCEFSSEDISQCYLTRSASLNNANSSNIFYIDMEYFVDWGFAYGHKPLFVLMCFKS